MTSYIVQAYGPMLPEAIANIFGRPPLIRGENENDYKALFEFIVREREPVTIGDWLLVKDYTDITWETFRERRIKVEMVELKIKQRKGMNILLSKKEDSELLIEAYLALEKQIDAFDRRQGTAQLRSFTIVREIERRRANRIASLPDKRATTAEKGEFEEAAE